MTIVYNQIIKHYQKTCVRMILIDMHVHITYILSEVLNNFTHNYEYQKNKKNQTWLRSKNILGDFKSH